MQTWPGIVLAAAFAIAGAAAQTGPGAAQPTVPLKKPVAAPTNRSSKAPTSTAPPGGPALFVDVTRAAGIDFHLNCGSKEKLYIVETQCGGAAAFDYDNDGWMDILLVDGSSIED